MTDDIAEIVRDLRRMASSNDTGFLDNTLTRAADALAQLSEWRQNQEVHWPMEIDRLNRRLTATESELMRLAKENNRYRKIDGSIATQLSASIVRNSKLQIENDGLREALRTVGTPGDAQ